MFLSHIISPVVYEEEEESDGDISMRFHVSKNVEIDPLRSATNDKYTKEE